MLLEGRVQFKLLLLYGVMSLACWPLVRERAHPSFKSASTKGPGRVGASHLTDFDETWPVSRVPLKLLYSKFKEIKPGRNRGELTTPLVFFKKK